MTAFGFCVVAALSNQIRYEALGVEYYTLLAGPRGPAVGQGRRETDLFAQ